MSFLAYKSQERAISFQSAQGPRDRGRLRNAPHSAVIVDIGPRPSGGHKEPRVPTGKLRKVFTEAVAADPRFLVDEVPLLALVRHAIPLSWTRDPFDRLVAAHSAARRVPLCSVDQRVRAHHGLLVPELM